jgi:hypothetical protein
MSVVIEGPPGTYKHALAEGLARVLRKPLVRPNSEYLEWTSKQMMGLPRRWAFTAVMAAMTATLTKTPHAVSVGTPETALRCYMPVLCTQMSTGEAQLLAQAAQALQPRVNPGVTVYIRGTPEHAMRRMQLRDASGDQWLTWKRLQVVCNNFQGVMTQRRMVIEVPPLDYRNDTNVDRVARRVLELFSQEKA